MVIGRGSLLIGRRWLCRFALVILGARCYGSLMVVVIIFLDRLSRLRLWRRILIRRIVFAERMRLLRLAWLMMRVVVCRLCRLVRCLRRIDTVKKVPTEKLNKKLKPKACVHIWRSCRGCFCLAHCKPGARCTRSCETVYCGESFGAIKSSRQPISIE